MTRHSAPAVAAIVLAAVTSALVACLAAGCRTGTVASGTARAAATRPATRPVAVTPLLDELVRSGSWLTRDDWAHEIRRMSYAPPQATPWRARDAYVGQLARAADAAGSGLKLLVVESVDGGTGAPGRYDRAVLAHGTALNAGAGGPLSLPEDVIRIEAPAEWAALDDRARALLGGDAPAGPEKAVHDAFEALVVTRFDGRRWESRSWSYLLWRAAIIGDATRVADLPEDVRAAIELAERINAQVAGKRRPFAPHFAGFAAEMTDVKRRT